MAARVVLDASALLLPFESGIRLESELDRLLGPYAALVPSTVRKELEVIAASGSGARAHNARMALALAGRFETRDAPGAGDDAVLALARSESALLCSVDRGLLRRALEAGLGVVRPKGRGHLIVETGQGEAR